jgi:hypothetical protein
VLEDDSGVEETRINLLRSKVTLANSENLRRSLTRGNRLGDLDLAEELLENPSESHVIRRTENLGDESTTLDKEFSCKLKRVENKLSLKVRILGPCSTTTDGRGTIMKHKINLPSVKLLLKSLTTSRSSDIFDESGDVGERLDGKNINTDDHRVDRHILRTDLEPTTRGSTEIKTCTGGF